MAGFSPTERKAAAVFVLLWAWLGWTELIWAGPVWDDWVEPVWFLLPELCCLCRVFVPVTQAPTVINSPGSLCMLTHTDKKWWRKKAIEGGRVRGWERTRRERTGGQHTVAYVDTDGQRATAWTQCIACAKKKNPNRVMDGKIQDWGRSNKEIYGFAFLGMKFRSNGVHSGNFN